MSEWIQGAINDAASGAWAKLVGFFTLSFIDPFWGWLTLGATIIGALTAVTFVLSYFFGDLFKWFRPLAGLIVVVVIALLSGFRRGENEARNYDKKHRRR